MGAHERSGVELADVTQAPAAEGRKLLRLEVRNAETPIERKPEWIKTRAKMGPEYNALQALVKSEGLHTVCQAAGCPNIFECWEDREATFLIGGDQCTRRCDFCQIDTGKPEPLDTDEPRRVAESVQKMELRYATITGVARDDLPDGGAWLYAETVRAIHELNPGTGVENLIPDFNGKPDLLTEVFESRPEVLAHNVETVPRIFKRIRPAFRYDRSLDVLTLARAFGLVTKSNLILGMGETRQEVSQALADLHDAGTELVTITQYLRPSLRHHPVERWVRPEEFVELAAEAERDRLLRCALRTAGSFVVPGRTAVPSGPAEPRRLARRDLRPRRIPVRLPVKAAATMSTPVAPEDLSRRKQLVQTYKMTRKSDRWIWLWLLLGVRGCWSRRVRVVLPPARTRTGLRDPRCARVRHPRGPDHLRPTCPARGVRPDGGSDRLRCRRTEDAAPGLEDGPGHRVQQAAGHRPPRRRPARDRTHRRRQPEPGQGAAGHGAPQARAGGERDARTRGRLRKRRGRGAAEEAGPARPEAGQGGQASAT